MLDIALLPGEYAVCRLPTGSPLPANLPAGPATGAVVSITWAEDAISVICPVAQVPESATVETPWRCLRVVGPLDLALTGIVASLAAPLADARVNIVAFSTFDTDYLLVPTVRLATALAALTDAGHRIVD